jgi:hypothetical protein
MNKKFLNKVLGQIMSETRIESTRGRVYTPYLPFSPSPLFFSLFFPLHSQLTLFSPSPLFSQHCENVYGLNNEEIDYVWKEYKDIIKDKIKNEQRISK